MPIHNVLTSSGGVISGNGAASTICWIGSTTSGVARVDSHDLRNRETVAPDFHFALFAHRRGGAIWILISSAVGSPISGL